MKSAYHNITSTHWACSYFLLALNKQCDETHLFNCDCWASSAPSVDGNTETMHRHMELRSMHGFSNRTPRRKPINTKVLRALNTHVTLHYTWNIIMPGALQLRIMKLGDICSWTDMLASLANLGAPKFKRSQMDQKSLALQPASHFLPVLHLLPLAASRESISSGLFL